MEDAQSRTILVLYGSETGNAQDMAEELGRICQRLHFQTTVEELDGISLVCPPFLSPALAMFCLTALLIAMSALTARASAGHICAFHHWPRRHAA